MEIRQKLSLDFGRDTHPITVFAKQNDTKTRFLEITPLNCGQAYALEDGVTPRLQLTKADGHTVLNDATVENGVIVVELTPQALAAAGVAVAEIGLYKGEAFLSSQIFYIDVERAAFDKDAPVSSDEFNALVDALGKVDGAVEKAEGAATAANDAADTATMAVEEILEKIVDEYVPKNQGAANVGKVLAVGTDGNLTLIDMPEGGVSGDVIGTLDESNNILLSGNLADGTYTLKYENEDGTYTEVGSLVVGAIVAEPTNLFTVDGDGYIESGRCSSTGEDRTDATSCFVTNYIDVEYGDIVYIKGYQTPTASSAYCGVKYTDGTTGGFMLETETTIVTDFSLADGIAQFTIDAENADYMRFTILKPSSLDDIIINIKRNGEYL